MYVYPGIISPPVTPPARYLGNITQIFFSVISLGLWAGIFASNTDRERSCDQYIQCSDVRWNAPMSELSVLKVLATVVDLFKMFNSTIGTFHHTSEHTLLRSSLAGLKTCTPRRPLKPHFSGEIFGKT